MFQNGQGGGTYTSNYAKRTKVTAVDDDDDNDVDPSPKRARYRPLGIAILANGARVISP